MRTFLALALLIACIWGGASVYYRTHSSVGFWDGVVFAVCVITVLQFLSGFLGAAWKDIRQRRRRRRWARNHKYIFENVRVVVGDIEVKQTPPTKDEP